MLLYAQAQYTIYTIYYLVSMVVKDISSIDFTVATSFLAVADLSDHCYIIKRYKYRKFGLVNCQILRAWSFCALHARAVLNIVHRSCNKRGGGC